MHRRLATLVCIAALGCQSRPTEQPEPNVVTAEPAPEPAAQPPHVPAATAPPPAGFVATSVVAATYARESRASEAVQRECDLQGKLPRWIAEYTGAAVPVSSAPASGRVLTLQITDVLGYGGGMYSGPKRLSVTGTLTENGTVIGTFAGRRGTMGGAFGGFKGTCSLLGRTAKALGRDIAAFVEAPQMNARLGELR